MTDFGRRVAVAAANVLPKTGETEDYHPGCDGYYEKGWEGDRFTNNGDGTITDNATSLMWPQNAASALLNMSDRNFADQIDHIENLMFAGHSDWRMPNAVEFLSMVDWSRDAPDINDIIINGQGEYWSVSTTFASNEDYTFYWSYATYHLFTTVKSSVGPSMCVRSI